VFSVIGPQVIAEAFRRAGLGVRFRRVPLQRAIEEANDGVTDGALNRVAEVATSFPNLVVVPTVTERSYVCVYADSQSILAKTREDIARMNIAYIRGVLLIRNTTQGMRVIEAQDETALDSMLADGQVDAVLRNCVDAELEQLQHRHPSTFIRWPHVWATAALHLVLNKRNAALVPRIDAALARMSHDGLIDKYYADQFRRLQISPPPRD
jgi:ABC-type amino acid transport substrate-binding protein